MRDTVPPVDLATLAADGPLADLSVHRRRPPGPRLRRRAGRR